MTATGYWDLADYGSTPWYNAGFPGDNPPDKKEIKILRGLAKKVVEIANLPEQKEKRDLWFRHNMLEATRPLIICDPENGWNEIITDDQLQCKSRLAKHWEMVLRKEIFWGENLCDDRPIESNFDVNYTFIESDWGIEIVFTKSKIEGSYHWEPGIKEFSDVDKLHYPEIEVDYDTTEKTIEVAKYVFNGLLDVRLIGKWWWGLGLSYELATLLGMEQMMANMIIEPNLIQSIMEILKSGTIKKIDFLEKNNLFSLNNDLYLPPGGFGYTNELPSKSYNGHVRTIDLWGYAESQETVGVSPNMFEKFIFPHQLEILSRFGLNSYGCCEPLDKRWEIIKNIPRLRKVSVSPWADRKKMTDYLGDSYCYCLKPNPAYLAVPEIDKDKIRNDLRSAFQISKGCRVEVLMQDNHTIGKNPNNVVNWVKIAKEEAERIV